MENFDGLDFMDDGDQGAVELSLLEEEQEQQNKKGSNRNSSGCSVIFNWFIDYSGRLVRYSAGMKSTLPGLETPM